MSQLVRCPQLHVHRKLYKTTPEMRIPPLIKTLYMVPAIIQKVYKTTPKTRPPIIKGVSNREVPLYSCSQSTVSTFPGSFCVHLHPLNEQLTTD